MSATLPQPIRTVATFAQLLSSVRRGARLTLTLDTATGHLRIAVTDAQGGQLPVVPTDSATYSETGRGLLTVDALADRWGTKPHPPAGKTVWATVPTSSTTATGDAPPCG
ncbi:ATP-binding protein [Streptomyces gramineus]|uniref:ATP-binding protein n=1 Tax=Streptomyces gramineus TaxID=910542 RepID=UPI00398BA332